MNDPVQNYLSTYRNDNFLKLIDIAFLLENDTGNLSKYESGQLRPNLKTVLGYNILFDIPIDILIKEDCENLSQKIQDKCFQLLERIQHEPKTIKNRKRKETLNKIISRLIPISYEEGE